MEQVPNSVKSKMGSTQIPSEGSKNTTHVTGSDLAQAWISDQSPYKTQQGTLPEYGDSPRASVVTEAYNNGSDSSAESSDRSLGKLRRFSKTQPDKKPVKSAGKLTERIKRAQQLSGLQFSNRVKYCGKTVHGAPEVELLQHGPGRVKKCNVAVCKNVWECAVCRPYIQYLKREEIRRVHDHAKDMEWESFMFSFTIPHKKNDDFETNLKTLNDSFNSLRADRQYKKLMASVGFVWSLRTLECTWGKRNGFHPHLHVLVTIRERATEVIRQIQSEILAIWGRVVSRIRNKRGIATSNILMRWMRKRSVKVTPVTDLAADYFVKHSWGTLAEVTDGGFSQKKAKGENWSLGELEMEMTAQYESTGQIEPWLRGVLSEFYKTMKQKKFITTQGEYKQILSELDESDPQEKLESEEDENHSNITGRVKIRSWFWDEILHKYGINYDLIGEVKCRQPGADFLEIRDFLIYEVWKIMKPIPIHEIEYLIDSNVFIETEESDSSRRRFFDFEKRKERAENGSETGERGAQVVP